MSKLEEIGNMMNEYEVKKLQLMMKLEQDQKLYVQQIPKIQRELLIVKEEIKKFQKAIDSKPITTKQVFTDLIHLDRVLQRMKETKSLLKDADNWNTVQMEMESLLISKDYAKAAKRLLEASSSLEMLSVTHNFESRKELLEKLTCEFLELIKSEFTKSCELNLFMEAKTLVALFHDFEKTNELVSHYCSIRKPQFTSLWVVQDPIVNTLPRFLDQIGPLLVSEFEYLTRIFDNPGTLLNKLLFSVLDDVQPSLQVILDKCSDSKKAILEIIKLYQCCTAFGSDIELKYPVSRNENEWGPYLFGLFVPFQKRFEYYEKLFLEYSLGDIFKTEKPVDVVSKTLFDLLEESLGRYNRFTQGLISVHLHSLYDEIICKVANYLILAMKKRTPVPSVVDTTITTLQSNLFIVPDNYETEFQGRVQDIKDCVLFLNSNTKFWGLLEKNHENIATSDNPCNSSLIPLKGLYREFRIHEQGDLKCNELTSQLVSLAQRNLLDALLLPITSFLGYIPQLHIWKAEGTDTSFSLSPSTYVTSVGEHLLTLPHLFDPFVQEEALMVSVQTLPFQDPLVVDEEDDVTFAWVFSAIKMTERMLLDQLFLVKNVSTYGMKQIITDLEYLQNVMAALEIDSDGDLQGMLEWLDKSKEELLNEKNDLVQKVLKIRGISS